MTLVRWSPLRDMDTLHHHFERAFPGMFESTGPGAIRPAVDVAESPDAYVMRVDLPGVKHDDVKVTLENDTLTIAGEKHQAAIDGDASYLHTERVHGAFERTFTLGVPIQPDKITARFADGVLEVRVLKSEQAKKQEIAIER